MPSIFVEGHYPVTSRCPFCGGNPKVKGRKQKQVVCRACGATGPRLPFLLDAITAWNNREELVVDGAKTKA